MVNQSSVSKQRRSWGVYLEALRPKQWVKNGLVFLPLLFAIDLAWAPGNLEPLPQLGLQLGGLFLAFCLLASGVYLFNDLMDRRSDRLHPIKKYRPIASGRLPVSRAGSLAVILVVAGLVPMFFLGWMLGVLGILYGLVNLAYSLGMKNIVLADVVLVASGYVIRAGAGAVAIGVTPSPWLYGVTAAGAGFLVLGRRYAEVRLAGDNPGQQRRVLNLYAGKLIKGLLIASAAAALVSYTLYAVQAPNLPPDRSMLITVPWVVLGLVRYMFLLNRSQHAESPEQLVTRDLPFVVAVAGWLATVLAVLILNT